MISFRLVTETVKKAYVSLFESGSSAASARHEYLTQLQLKSDPREVESTHADRAIQPNVQNVQRLFRKWLSDNIGPKMERLCLSDCSRKDNNTTRNMKKRVGEYFFNLMKQQLQ